MSTREPAPYSWQIRWNALPVTDQQSLEAAVLDLVRRHRSVPCAALAMLFDCAKMPLGCDLKTACLTLAKAGFLALKTQTCIGVTVPSVHATMDLFLTPAGTTPVAKR